MVEIGGGSNLGTTIQSGEIDDAAVTDAKIADAVVKGNAIILLEPELYEQINSGSWARQANASFRYGECFHSSNNGAELQYKLALDKGTYLVKALFEVHSNAGKLDIEVDGSVVGTLDTYDSSYNASELRSDTITINSSTGLVDLKLTINGKNASSGDYQVGIQGAMQFIRQT